MDQTRDRLRLRLFLALALTCLLGWQFKAHCTIGGWSNAEQYATGCYNDAIPFWDGRGVAAGKAPYVEARMEYPVLTGALIGVEGDITRALFGERANAVHFLRIVALVNALFAGVVLWLLWRGGMDATRLWAWALAPPLILYVGHNWDLLAVAFAVSALLAARAGRPVAAAALAGLGFAAKLFPILLVALLGLQALFSGEGVPDRRRLVHASAIGAAAIGAWSMVNLPYMLLAWENWAEFFTFSAERSGTAASLWQILATFGWLDTTIATRNTASALLFMLGFVTIVALGWPRHRERLWVLFTPALAWFLLTNKVYSPQFDLWLYPLLVMTAPRLRPVGLFVVAGIAAYFAEFWMFAGWEGASPSATELDVALAAGVRAIAMLWIIADVLRRDPPEWLAPPTL